jgi:hypothetical protein
MSAHGADVELAAGCLRGDEPAWERLMRRELANSQVRNLAGSRERQVPARSWRRVVARALPKMLRN